MPRVRSLLVPVSDWPLSTRMLVGLLVCALLPGLLFGYLSMTNSARSIRELERAEASRLAASAALAFRPEQEAMLRNVKDYSIWSRTYEAVQKGDRKWLRTQVTSWVPATFRVRALQIVDRRLRTVGAFGAPERVLGRATLAGLVSEVRARKWVSGVVAGVRRPYLVAGSVVLRDDYRGTPAGVMVFATPLDNGFVQRVSRQIQADVAVIHGSRQVASTGTGRWPVPRATAPGAGSPYRTAELTGRDGTRELVAYRPVPTVVPGPRVLVGIRHSTRTTRAVAASIMSAGLVHVGFAAVLAMLTALVVSAIVARPITRLDLAVQRVISTDDLSQHVRVVGGGETGHLARSFNEMLDRLEASRRRQLDFQAKLEERSGELAEDVWASGRRYQNLLEDTAEGVLATDSHGKLTLTNRQAAIILGSTPAELVGRYLGDLLGPAAEGGLPLRKGEEFERRLKAGSVPRVSEWSLVGPDGSCSLVELRLSALVRHGQVVGAQGALHDITEEQRTRELRSNLLSVVSHELKTPLSVVYACATTLARPDIEDEGARRGLVQDIIKQSEYLMSLVGDMLAASQMREGRMVVETGPVKLGEIAQDVVSSISRYSPGYRFSVDFPGDFSTIQADERGMKQVITNLVSNAVRHSPGGADVSVAGKVSGGEVIVSVSDTGPGIRERDIDRIFDQFAQADMSSTRPTRGVGLGLYICKQVVELHGGRIWVESRPGKGSTFSFALPLAG